MPIVLSLTCVISGRTGGRTRIGPVRQVVPESAKEAAIPFIDVTNIAAGEFERWAGTG